MKSSELLRILTKDGWYKVSQKGSHIKMMHPLKKGVLFVPYHGSKEIAKGTELHLLKSAGLK